MIDFEVGSWSPILRPGRSLATLQRIEAGRRKFGPRFVMPYYGSGSGLTGRSLERPIGTLTTKARWGIVDGDRMRMPLAHEVCAFMGFPPSCSYPESLPVANILFGNAVCPPVARDVIKAIREAA